MDPGADDINGTVNGGTISFGTVGSQAITYSGSVSGDSMSGTYKVQSGRLGRRLLERDEGFVTSSGSRSGDRRDRSSLVGWC